MNQRVMHKVLFSLFVVLMFTLGACGGGNDEEAAGSPTLVATLPAGGTGAGTATPSAGAATTASGGVTDTETSTGTIAGSETTTVTEELAGAVGVTDSADLTDSEAATSSLVSEDVRVITDTRVITGTEVTTDVIVTTNTVVLTQELVTTVVTATNLVTNVGTLTEQSTSSETQIITDTSPISSETSSEGVIASVAVTGTTPTPAPTRRPTATPTVVVNLTRVVTNTIVVTDTVSVSATATPAARTTVTRTGVMTDTNMMTSTRTITRTRATTSAYGILGAASRTVRVSQLLDYDVQNLAGDDIGDVNDMIVSLPDGRVLYATMQYGGVLGIGQKTFPIPLSAFRINAGQGVTGTGALTGTAAGAGENVLLLNVAEETLENAPGYDEGGFDLTSADFDADVNAFWSDPGLSTLAQALQITDTTDVSGSAGVTATSAVSRTIARTSDLLGYNIENADGDNIGEINDLLIDLGNGRVAYAVLSFGGILGLGDSLVAIPLRNFSVTPQTDGGTPVITLNVEPEQLETAPVFDPNAFPDTNVAGWDDSLRQYWNENN